MKNLNILFLALFLVTLSNNLIAQDCPFPQSQKMLKSKNIAANILTGGDLFWDRSEPSFQNNIGETPSLHTIYTAGLWMGGFTGLFSTDPQITPNLKLAGAVYNSASSRDYSTGPLSNEGTIDFTVCENFDQLWEVFGSEIKEHIEDFNDDGIVTIKQDNIYKYPGQQNPFFEDLNGFSLPDSPQGFAPFFDNDNDGVYNPDNGDYPLPTAVHKDHYPDHLIWSVFNDAGNNHSGTEAEAIRAEVQLTAWAFSCTDNEILNNSIFTSHKIINKSLESLDSVYLGMFVDFDIGCSTDDYLGCIPDMNTFYGYNSDNSDGDVGTVCTSGGTSSSFYQNNLPVQAATFLNHDMASFHVNSILPNHPSQFYNNLSGRFNNGSPQVYGGDGLNSGGAPTSFLFDGNPNNPDEWSMQSEASPNGFYKAIGSVYIETLFPQQSFTMDMAYTFYQDENLDNFETVNLVYDNTPLLQQMYDERFEMSCTDLYLPTKDLEPTTIEIFPNPATEMLNMNLDKIPTHLSIFDIYGKRVLEKTNGFENEMQLPIAHFSAGVYFVKIKIGEQDFVKKVIKL